MKKWILILAVAALALIVWLWWRNLPNNAATRFLDDLAEHASFDRETAALAQNARAGGLARYFGEQVEFKVSEARMNGNMSLQDIQGAYAGVGRSGSADFTLAFSDIDAVKVDGLLQATCRAQATYSGPLGNESRDEKVQLRWNEEKKLISIVEIKEPK